MKAGPVKAVPENFLRPTESEQAPVLKLAGVALEQPNSAFSRQSAL